MRKCVTLVFLLVSGFISTLATSGAAHAQIQKVVKAPLTHNCIIGTIGCYRFQEWDGHTYGAYTITTVSNPPLTSEPSYWERNIDMLAGSSQGWGTELHFGMVKQDSAFGGAGSPCDAYASGLYYYAYALSQKQAGILGLKCIAVPSGDVDSSVILKYSNYVSNGGGNLIQIIHGNTDRLDDWIPNSLGMSSWYNNYEPTERINDYLTNGKHEVWGVAWDYNQWATGDGVFHFVTTNGGLHGGVPPQMYWNILPPNSSTGGELWSCVYDSSTNACILDG